MLMSKIKLIENLIIFLNCLIEILIIIKKFEIIKTFYIAENVEFFFKKSRI